MTILARTSKQKAPGEPGTDKRAESALDEGLLGSKPVSEKAPGKASGKEPGAAANAAAADGAAADGAAAAAVSAAAGETGGVTAGGTAGKTPDKAPGAAADGAAAAAAGETGGDTAGKAAGKTPGAASGAAADGETADGASEASADNESAADEPADNTSDEPGDEASSLAAERDRYLRLAAEYDNFRKRSTKEMKTAYSDAKADTIIRLLPVYDNLERALKTECADEAFFKGVEMTMTQLTEILEGMGVTTIKAAGEPFDPNRHNAVAAIENPDLGEKTVAEEYQKGFMLGERVLRFSTVVVAN